MQPVRANPALIPSACGPAHGCRLRLVARIDDAGTRLAVRFESPAHRRTVAGLERRIQGGQRGLALAAVGIAGVAQAELGPVHAPIPGRATLLGTRARSCFHLAGHMPSAVAVDPHHPQSGATAPGRRFQVARSPRSNTEQGGVVAGSAAAAACAASVGPATSTKSPRTGRGTPAGGFWLAVRTGTVRTSPMADLARMPARRRRRRRVTAPTPALRVGALRRTPIQRQGSPLLCRAADDPACESGRRAAEPGNSRGQVRAMRLHLGAASSAGTPRTARHCSARRWQVAAPVACSALAR